MLDELEDAYRWYTTGVERSFGICGEEVTRTQKGVKKMKNAMNLNNFSADEIVLKWPGYPSSFDTKREDKNKMYSFNSVSDLAIDFDVIANDTTSKNPVLYVKKEDDSGWLVVHRSLANKSQFLGEDIYKNRFYTWNGHLVIFCKTEQAKRQWVKLFKEVRKAEWPERNKSVITVQNVEI